MSPGAIAPCFACCWGLFLCGFGTWGTFFLSFFSLYSLRCSPSFLLQCSVDEKRFAHLTVVPLSLTSFFASLQGTGAGAFPSGTHRGNSRSPIFTFCTLYTSTESCIWFKFYNNSGSLLVLFVTISTGNEKNVVILIKVRLSALKTDVSLGGAQLEW